MGFVLEVGGGAFAIPPLPGGAEALTLTLLWPQRDSRKQFMVTTRGRRCSEVRLFQFVTPPACCVSLGSFSL